MLWLELSLNLLLAKVDGQSHSNSIYMRGNTASRVFPLVIAFQFKALADREGCAERIGILAPRAGRTVVVDFSPRVWRKPKGFNSEGPRKCQSIAIPPRKLAIDDTQVEAVSLC